MSLLTAEQQARLDAAAAEAALARSQDAAAAEVAAAKGKPHRRHKATAGMWSWARSQSRRRRLAAAAAAAARLAAAREERGGERGRCCSCARRSRAGAPVGREI